MYKDEDFISAKDLINIRAYTSVSSAYKALQKVRKSFGIPSYGKVTFKQYKEVFVHRAKLSNESNI